MPPLSSLTNLLWIGMSKPRARCSTSYTPYSRVEYDEELFFGVALAVTCCGFEPLQSNVQSFPMGRGERLKLNADSLCSRPAHNGVLNEDRGFVF